MTKKLEGKVALVTGARGGLGAAIAVALAEQGARVVVTGRKEGDCAGTVARIAEVGGWGLDMALDVTDLTGVAKRVLNAQSLAGPVDILVNNAATIAPQAMLADLDAEAFDAAMRVNVSGPVALTSAVWPMMKGRGGRIVNVVSGASNRAISGWAAYCASKSALMMLTKSIELEGAADGIRGFGFAPGLVDTDMQANIRAIKINEIGSVPRENLLPPSKPAGVIAWLATGDADDLAGQFLDIRQEGLLARAGLA